MYDSNANGHGLHVMELKYSQFEWHPNKKKYPNMARMKFKNTKLSVPDDAHEKKKAFVGKYYTWYQYFTVDRDHKLLDLLGNQELPDETTDSTGYGNGHNPLVKTETLDGSTWEYNRRDDWAIEEKLNKENSVLMGVNFSSQHVVKTGDITGNIAFYFVEPSTTRVEGCCPNFMPAKESPTTAKLEKLGVYLEADDDAFRKPNDTSKHVVSVESSFESILQVETTFERFGAKLTVEISWDITKLDIVDYIASNNSPDWRPAWSPPAFVITNPATNREENLQIGSRKIKIKSVKDAATGKEKFVAMLTIHVSGEFYEAFELQNYPFDVQPLTIDLEAAQATGDDAVFEQKQPTLPDEVRDTEWHGRGSTASSSYDEGRYRLKIEAIVKRHSAVHMFRVVAVLAAISLTAVTSMCKDPDVTCLERIGLTVTLMLTATAYSLVIATSIPTLGYLTLLDKYILSTFAYIIVVTGAVVGLEWADVEDSGETPNYGLMGSAGLWILMHIVYGIIITCRVIPAEEKKGLELETGNHLKKKKTA